MALCEEDHRSGQERQSCADQRRSCRLLYEGNDRGDDKKDRPQSGRTLELRWRWR
jgi:hypothetical protein